MRNTRKKLLHIAYIASYVLILLPVFLIARKHVMGRWSITQPICPDIFWIDYRISGITIRQLSYHLHYMNRKLHEDHYKLFDFKSSMCWSLNYFAIVDECHPSYLIQPIVVWRNRRLDHLQIISSKLFNFTRLVSLDPCNHCFWALLRSSWTFTIVARVPKFKEKHCYCGFGK